MENKRHFSLLTIKAQNKTPQQGCFSWNAEANGTFSWFVLFFLRVCVGRHVKHQKHKPLLVTVRLEVTGEQHLQPERRRNAT